MQAREFLEDNFGLASTKGRPWHIRRVGRLVDPFYELQMRSRRTYRQAKKMASLLPRQRVLILSVANPSRSQILSNLLGKLSSELHDIHIKTKAVDNLGRFENLNIMLKDVELHQYDWLAIIDDDIDVSTDFFDLFLFLCHHHKFRIAMPAHRIGSYISYDITRRTWPYLARATNFVESGPFLLLHKETFSHILPFPELRYGWGADIHWAWLARTQGWPIGIVDAAPLKHLKPVGGSYSRDEAVLEAAQYLGQNGFLSRRDTFSTIEGW